jgi:siroheme synthase (precorrin-2 oxidase/ferrochelatase)
LAISEARRSDDFLREFARSAENTASIATQLTIENEELARKLSKDAKRLRELNAVFRKLQETSHNQTRALPPQLHALQPKAASPSARKK